MYILQTLTALAALAVAVPVEERGVGDTIHQVAVPRLHRRSAVVGLERAMLKYNVEVPENVREAAASARTASVPAKNLPHDQAYVAPVHVGTPGQALMLDIDTGSSDLWVYSSMTQNGASKGHSVYSPGKSSTSHLLKGYQWRITYGDGTGANGNVYADKVAVGAVTATQHAVEVAKSVSPRLAHEIAVDGIFGFAFKPLNQVKPHKQPPWIASVGPSLAKDLFAAHLAHDKPGFYNIGFIDKSAYRGTIAYTAVDNRQGFWLIRPGGFYVGGAKHARPFIGIVDTGTSLNFLPQAVAAAYYSKVRGAGQSLLTGVWTFPCSSTPPDFSLIINGQKRTMPGQYMKYVSQGGTCEGGIQTAFQGMPNVIGDVFLKSQYVVFDRKNLQVGFAQQ